MEPFVEKRDTLSSDRLTVRKLASEVPNKGATRLIVVDDDQGLLDLYRRVLGTVGKGFDSSPPFDIELHSRGDDAIESVKRAIHQDVPFAVAFVDIVLPDGPDGYETASRMRDLDPSIEIVFVTGYPDAEKLENARDYHPKEKLLFIQKPFAVLELRQMAIALSAKWHAEKRLRKTQTQLEEQTRHVVEINQALSVLAQNIQRSREESNVRLSLEIQSKVLPILKEIRAKVGKDEAAVELDMLESYMKEITSNVTSEAGIASSLTPSEMRIACMIKNGFTNLRIADKMFISVGTVKTHRKNIRNKLDIRNSNQNLRTFLRAKMDDLERPFSPA